MKRMLAALAALAAAASLAHAAAFVRCDQASKQRAPYNVADVTYIMSKDFAAPAADAKKVIDHLSHTRTPFPVYLGTIDTARFASEPTYRAHVLQVAKEVASAAKVQCLLYVREESPKSIPAALASDVQALATHATLAVATRCDGLMTRDQVRERVKYVHDHFGETLKVPLPRLLVDVDLSQTTKDQPFGTRARQENFDHVVAWALEEAFALHLGGFHTMGNARNQNRATRAADSTYRALNEAWSRLAAAHPGQEFPGLRPQKPKAR